MNLAEKMKHLRAVEGELRGLNRPMTQMEVVKAMQEELNESISQAYLSQLESSKRLHLTASSRELLSRFFKVYPGYLVNDPPDYSTDLLSEIDNNGAERLNTWLTASAAEWRSEPVVEDLLQRLAEVDEPLRYIEAFEKLMELPIESLEAITEAITAPEKENEGALKLD